MIEDAAGAPQQDSDGLLFNGMVAFFVEVGVLQIRLQIWKRKFESLGGKLEDHVTRRLTHIFAGSLEHLLERIDSARLKRLKKFKVTFLKYDWLEECLKAGQQVPVEAYNLFLASASAEDSADSATESLTSDTDTVAKEDTSSPQNEDREGIENAATQNEQDTNTNRSETMTLEKQVYTPPNLNQNITGPFEELKNIYKDALGDDRRSFSYYKAISHLEKLPFKITSVDEVKNVPTVGKSLQDHIHEILTTGKLSKLEHFKEDEKVKTVTLFGSVWGIGPATALKLYEKGHRTLEDLAREKSLTYPQRMGLQFYDDIKTRIPRDKAKDMEKMIQEIGEEVQPGISIVCGGSYRRGKSSIGDMDMIVTHPDGFSHKLFLRRFVYRLKELDFLTEDLLIGYHEDPNDDGVNTYFGLCKYPGKEQRHRIDFKVYSWKQYPFGLIAWTGNDVLNRRLRILADEKGYKLDDTGLYRRSTYQDNKRHKAANKNISVPCKTEREVFEFLGHPWLEPNDRNL